MLRRPRRVDPHSGEPGRVEAVRPRPPVQYEKFWALVVCHERWNSDSSLNVSPSMSCREDPCDAKGLVQATWSLDSERGLPLNHI